MNQSELAGFVIRNEKWDPIVAGTKFIGQNTISLAECLAPSGWLVDGKV